MCSPDLKIELGVDPMLIAFEVHLRLPHEALK